MKSDIDLLIWTFNRPCQCESLLNSIYKFAPNLFNITVSINYNDDKISKGYDILKDIFPKINYIYRNQETFRGTTLDWLKSRNRYVCFSTDDTILYRHVSNIPHIYLENNIFSLRLGYNTIIQNHFENTYQNPLQNTLERDGIITWLWSNYNPLYRTSIKRIN